MGVWDDVFDVCFVGVESILVNAKTAEDAAALCDILTDCGCTWPNGTSLRESNNWTRYGAETTYCIGKDLVVRYGRRTDLDAGSRYYTDYIKCSFNSELVLKAVPDLVLPEEDIAGYVLL